MQKYLTVFAVSWQNEFIYRLNFILWRLRNVVRFLMTYFLWLGVFTSAATAFGYSQPQILAYVFMVLVVQSVVLSSPSADRIGGEIASGDLSNYLVKPVNYLRYWFTRDLSSKFLNLLFASVEITALWLIFRPELSLPFNAWNALGFIASCLLAMAINFFLSTGARFTAFWMPESTWGFAFVLLVFIEVLAGGIFPLDILPKWAFNILQFTPFPYLIYYPIAIFIGKVEGWDLLRVLLQSVAMALIMFFAARYIWRKGLRVYGAEGR